MNQRLGGVIFPFFLFDLAFVMKWGHARFPISALHVLFFLFQWQFRVPLLGLEVPIERLQKRRHDVGEKRARVINHDNHRRGTITQRNLTSISLPYFAVSWLEAAEREEKKPKFRLLIAIGGSVRLGLRAAHTF
ncbi:hypothetical protein HOY82DRAFT_558684 [Tuber indicum]|nr:hypothetical protein HOY82DRAFT_558684 [Tuber indicum]